MQIHNGIRYKDKHAKQLGLTKARQDAQDTARKGPDGDKARRPARTRTKGKEASDGDAGTDHGEPPAAG